MVQSRAAAGGGSAADSGPPIFLVGAERSGSTMLGLMLARHPEIAWLGEFEYAVDFLQEGGGLPDVAAFRAWLPTDRRFRAQQLAVDETLSYRDLVDSFLEQVRRRTGKPLVGAALHRGFEWLPELWPEARFVHLVRDGRDVALSRMRMGWAGNPWVGCSPWRAAEEAWERLRSRLSAESFVELRFEDLVRRPRDELQRMCVALGVGYSPEMLRYPEESRYERPDPSAAERWRERMSPRELGYVESEIGDLLARRGYPPSGIAPAVPGRLARLRLQLQDRCFRIAFRFRRYGWALIVAEFVARRLRLDPLQRRLRLRIDAITTRHLQ